MKFSKLLLLSCVIMAPMAMASKRSKKLDLLVFPADPSYVFAMNDGSGISTNPAELRPAGSTVTTSYLIFPGGTVSKHQTDFSVDRHGKVLDPSKNLGVVYASADMLTNYDPLALPVSGTAAEVVEMVFDFRKSCDSENLIFAEGLGTMDVIPAEVGSALMKIVASVVGGAGCNQYQFGNYLVAKVYQATSGTVPTLIQVKFYNDVEYNK